MFSFGKEYLADLFTLSFSIKTITNLNLSKELQEEKTNEELPFTHPHDGGLMMSIYNTLITWGQAIDMGPIHEHQYTTS